jgi:hypothetical protein
MHETQMVYMGHHLGEQDMLLPGAEIALLTPINTLCNYSHRCV